MNEEGYRKFRDEVLKELYRLRTEEAWTNVFVDEVADSTLLEYHSDWLKRLRNDFYTNKIVTGGGETIPPDKVRYFFRIGQDDWVRIGDMAASLPIIRTSQLPMIASQPINWTKWGTVFAGIGIVVAIIIALVG